MYLLLNKYTKYNKSKLEGVNPLYPNGSTDAYRTIMISTIISMHSLIQSWFKKYKYISDYNIIELYTYAIIILHRVYVIVCHATYSTTHTPFVLALSKNSIEHRHTATHTETHKHKHVR